MSKMAVFCIAASEFQAVCIVDRLKDAGFLNTDTSLLFVDKTDARFFANYSPGTAIPKGAVGAMLGGIVGWLPDVDTFVFPGLGPVVAAGPISTTLIAAVASGMPQALVSIGIPPGEAWRYKAKVKQGGILISVRVADTAQAQVVETIFKEEDARDVASTSSIPVPKRRTSSQPVIRELGILQTVRPTLVAPRESRQ